MAWVTIQTLFVFPNGSIGGISVLLSKDSETGEYEMPVLDAKKLTEKIGIDNGGKMLTPDMIDLGGGSSSNNTDDEAVIASVMRRWQANSNQDEMTPCIDLYPPWNPEKTFGIFKITTVWLNTDEDKKAFNDATGIDWKELPVYGGESAVPSTKRDPNRTDKFDIPLPKPITIKVLKEKIGVKSDGKDSIRTKFAGWKPLET